MKLAKRLMLPALIAATYLTGVSMSYASQGPGVRPGTANWIERYCAMAIIGVLVMLILVGIVKWIFALGPPVADSRRHELD